MDEHGDGILARPVKGISCGIVTSSASSVGAHSSGHLVRAQRAPGADDPILWARVQHFLGDGSMVCAAPAAGSLGGGESRFRPTVALEYDTFRTPPVDCTHLHLVNLIVRFDTLNNARHPCPPFPLR